MYIICCGKTDELGYLNINVALLAMAIFTSISRLNIHSNTVIRFLTDNTWGIYLIHPLFINIVNKICKLDVLTAMPCMKLFILEVGVLAATLAVVYVLKKIPLIKWLL